MLTTTPSQAARNRTLHATWMLVVTVACVSAGCAKRKPIGTIAPPPLVVAPIVIPPRTPRAQLFDAIEALNNGNVAGSRKDLLAVLARNPRDRIARDLLQQIDTDPRKLLGESNYTYEIKPGETLATIAARRLGRSTRFWALARYNNITVPVTAVPGQLIQIPGTIKFAPPSRAPSSTQAASTQAAPPRAAPVAPIRRAATRTDPVAASRLRRAGLAELARGSIDRAVTFLSRAFALDPANPAITADLARARRIQDVLRRP